MAGSSLADQWEGPGHGRGAGSSPAGQWEGPGRGRVLTSRSVGGAGTWQGSALLTVRDLLVCTGCVEDGLCWLRKRRYKLISRC